MKLTMYVVPRIIICFFLSGAIVHPVYALLYKKEAVSMNDMLNLAVKYNPTIRSSIASIHAARGNQLQASLTLNPSITIEVEDFAGSGEVSRFDGAEITASIEQTIEIAGKRLYRAESASHLLSVTEHQALIDMLNVLFETQVSTIKYFIAKKRLDLIEKQLVLIEETHDTIQKRVDGAASSDIEHTKMDIQRKSVLIEKINAQKSFEMASATLSRVLSREISNIKITENLLDELPSIPKQSVLIGKIKYMPQSKVLGFLQKQAESNFNLAKANSIPNPTFGVGFRRFNNNNSNAVVASFSIPIPVLNRNQGQIAKANAQLSMAKTNLIAGVQSLEESVKIIWSQFNAAKSEATTYNKDIIPDSEKAYKQALEGYDMGRFSFLQLLDAQRTLYKMQESQLNSLSKLYESQAYIDYLVGTHEKLLIKNTLLSNGDTL